LFRTITIIWEGMSNGLRTCQAVHAYSSAVIFPVADEMTFFSHGPNDPKHVGPAPFLLRGVKKRICTPGLPSLNYTCMFEGEKVVEELKGHKKIRVSFVNEVRW